MILTTWSCIPDYPGTYFWDYTPTDEYWWADGWQEEAKVLGEKNLPLCPS
jgi:hypothetical protein